MNYSAQKATGTQAIQRAAFLLREIAANNRTGVRLVDLATSAKLEQPTAHRIVKSLVAEDLVEQEAGSRKYFLGRAAYEFGLAAAYRFNIRELCQPALERLAEETGDTVFLTGRSGVESVCLDRKDGKFPIKIYTFTPGERRLVGMGAGGRAILSALQADEIKGILNKYSRRFYEYNRCTPERMLALVRADQRRGYTLHDVVGASEVKSIALPIKDRSGEPVAALSISGLGSRIIGDRLPHLLKLLRTEVRTIEQLLNNQT